MHRHVLSIGGKDFPACLREKRALVFMGVVVDFSEDFGVYAGVMPTLGILWCSCVVALRLRKLDGVTQQPTQVSMQICAQLDDVEV